MHDLPTPDADPDAALRRQLDDMRAAFRRDGLPSWTVRADRLRRLRALITENRDAICAAIDADFSRRPAEETALLEIFPSLQEIAHALRSGQRWMRVRRKPVGFWFRPAKARLLPQPLGVIGIIAPWNYPLFLAAGPLAAALVAGNRAMLKLSELAPRFGALFAQLAERYFDRHEVAVVNGDAVVGGAFAALPFDHLLFTGSARVGRMVMEAASRNLTPVTLELGGKSPAFIGPDADIERAADSILYGKLINAGQTCIAPDYVLLPAGAEARFLRAAQEACTRMYPAARGWGDYAAIISERHRDRLNDLLADARMHGAELHPLGSSGTEGLQGRQLAPVMLTGVRGEMLVMQEEIFGPLLPIQTYTDLDDAIRIIRDRPHPLALYVFARDRSVVDRVLHETSAGGVTVNDTLLHIAQHDLPFGGVGESGMGAYHGEEGFRTFSKMKPVVYQSRFNLAWLARPPYGKRVEKILKLMMRA